MDTIGETVREVVHQATEEENILTTNSLQININEVQHAGLSVYAKCCLLSNEAFDMYKNTKAKHNL